jgi:hypothetical protein
MMSAVASDMVFEQGKCKGGCPRLLQIIWRDIFHKQTLVTESDKRDELSHQNCLLCRVI